MGTEKDVAPEVAVPPLRDGDRLARAEFERRYTAMPENVHAELFCGVVRLWLGRGIAPAGHARARLAHWLGQYEAHTAGVGGSLHGTVRLGADSEPQPDAVLRVSDKRVGQSWIDEDDFIAGAPELAAQASYGTLDVDLGPRLWDYERFGIREYVLWRVPDGALDWFVLRNGQYDRLQAGADGLIRSEAFPGLWLDVAALLRGDGLAVAAAVQNGIASTEHAAFVRRLAEEAARRAT
jgi:Uma2 family endonuclease